MKKSNKTNDREMVLAELVNQMAGGSEQFLDDSFDSKLDELSNEELQQLFAVGRFVKTLQNVCLDDATIDFSQETGIPNGTGTTKADTLRPAIPLSSTSDSVPQSIGKFVELRLAGQGGFANIYQAFDPDLQRHVALKIPHSERLATETLRERFRREGRAAGILSHEAIVPVYEAGSVDGIDYISCEWVDGINLQQWMKNRKGVVPFAEAAAAIARIADGIACAHARKILHRDLKPANVMVARDSDELSWHKNLKVTDFGLARDLEDAEDAKRLTTEGSIMGTPAYMAPEQARCDENCGPAADVYALGAILYELLTGQPPHLRSSYTATLMAIENDSVVPIEKSRTDVPADLRAICMKCLEFQSADRYENARQLADDLVRFANGQPVSARRVNAAGKLLRWSKRNPGIAALLCLSFALLISGLAVSNWFLQQAIDDQEIISAKQQEAERQANIKQEAMDSILGSFKRTNPVLNGLGQLTPTEILEASQKDIQNKFADDKSAQAKLLSGLAVGYMGLGLQAEAAECRLLATRLFDESIGPLEIESMEELQRLAHNQMYAGQLKESLESHKELLRRCSQLTDESDLESRAVFSLAELQMKLGQFDDCMATLAFRSNETIEYGETRRKLLQIKAFREAGYLDQALETSKSYWQVLKDHKGPNAVVTLKAKREYVLALTDAERFVEAVPLADELLQTWTRIRGADSIRVMEQSQLNGWLLLHANKIELADKIVSGAIVAGMARYGATHTLVLSLVQIQARCRALLGDTDDAIMILDRAIGQRSQQSTTPNPITLSLVIDLAHVYRNAKQTDLASELLEPFRELIAEPSQLDPEEVIRLRTEYIHVFAESGKPAEVIPLSRLHIKSIENRAATSPVDIRYARFQLIHLLLQDRDFENAISETESFIESLNDLDSLNTRLRIETFSLLAIAQLELGKSRQARSTAIKVLSDPERFEPYKSLMLAVNAAGMARDERFRNGKAAQASMLGVLLREHFPDSNFDLRFLMLLTAERLERAVVKPGDVTADSSIGKIVIQMRSEMFGDRGDP